MVVLSPIVEPLIHFAAIKIAQFAHRCKIGSKSVRYDFGWRSVPLQGFLHESPGCFFVAPFRDIAFKDDAFMIHGAPKITHLVEVLLPVTVAAHPADALALYLAGEQRAETVPLKPNSFVADIDAAPEQQVFDIPQAQRVTNIHHHHEPDHLWLRIEIPKRAGGRLGHIRQLACSNLL